jgi:predicted Holliday junction resolvase-like endonuclease
VNIGKNLEKIFPTLKNFKWEIPDTRFLGDPIDLIIFKGLSQGNVEWIDFVEIKTGKAPLNKRQKSIRSAIENNDVSYKVFK